MHHLIRNKLLLATYIMTVLFALHYGIPLYATSTYLNTFFNSSIVGSLFMVGSFFTLLASLHFTKYLRKFHTYPFILSIVIGEIIATVIFALSTNPYLTAISFVIHFCLQALILIILNLFTETFTKHAETGMVRGLFLSLLNLGILIAPFIGGAILGSQGFTALYIVAALILLPFIFFLHRFMRHAPDPNYHSLNVPEALTRALDNKNLRGAFVAIFLLECFYAVMVIYFPIYITSLGVPLVVYLTAIIPVALIPLVVLPYELGMIADKKFGEKEMLIFGLLITAGALLAISVITTAITIVWILVLLISRVGASLIETMTYTYFYKKIHAEDASLTAAFTNMRSVATIVVTGFGIVLTPLLVVRPELMFVLLALALLLGITYVLPIKDTR
jgi:MFS family permease